MAAAEVKLSGSANMGVKYTEGTTQEVQLHHEIQIDASGSAATDNGLTFTADLDIEADRGSNALKSPDASFSVAGAFGKLTIGDTTDRASDIYEVGAVEVGFDGIGLDDVAEGKYARGASDVLYTNTFGAFSMALSTASADGDDSISAAVAYKGPVTISVGFADDGTDQAISVGLKGSAAGFGYQVFAVDDDAEDTSYGVGFTYGLGNGMTLKAGYADSDAAPDASYGIGLAYALGGGVTLEGGFGSITDRVGGTGADKNDYKAAVNKADIGVNFSF